MNTNNMPPLPHHPEPHTMTWTALELKAIEAYGQLCRKQALEEAAKVCRETALSGERSPTPYRDGYIDGFNRGADQCERSIKSLK